MIPYDTCNCTLKAVIMWACASAPASPALAHVEGKATDVCVRGFKKDVTP